MLVDVLHRLSIRFEWHKPNALSLECQIIDVKSHIAKSKLNYRPRAQRGIEMINRLGV